MILTTEQIEWNKFIDELYSTPKSRKYAFLQRPYDRNLYDKFSEWINSLERTKM